MPSSRPAIRSISRSPRFQPGRRDPCRGRGQPRLRGGQAQFPKAKLLSLNTPTDIQLFETVRRGDADAAFANGITIRWWLKAPGHDWATVAFTDDFSTQPNGWAIRYGDPAWKDFLDSSPGSRWRTTAPRTYTSLPRPGQAAAISTRAGGIAVRILRLLWEYPDPLLAGVWMTVVLSVLAMLISLVVGLIACARRHVAPALDPGAEPLFCRVRAQHADHRAAHLGALRAAGHHRREVHAFRAARWSRSRCRPSGYLAEEYRAASRGSTAARRRRRARSG